MTDGADIGRDLDGLRLKPAPGSLAVVQGFVNTRNALRGYDLLGDAEGANGWLRGRGFLDRGSRLDESGRREVVAFREGLRGLLLAHNGGGSRGDAGLLNELAEDALLRVQFDDAGVPGLVAAGAGTAASGTVARLLAAVVRASCGGEWRRLKACRNEECTWVFYDGSKNLSGSWCTMDVCGSRAKMRAYRRRLSS